MKARIIIWALLIPAIFLVSFLTADYFLENNGKQSPKEIMRDIEVTYNNSSEMNNPTESTGVEESQEAILEPEIENRFLDGNWQKQAVIAAVIDNFSEARPLSGLDQAVIVYEVPVEADLTRLVGIFSYDFLPEKIGPIRSARPYLAELAGEYKPLFIHAGGSSDFLSQLKSNKYRIYNLDEISANGIYFWRSQEREKPHNLYISKSLITKAVEDKKLTEALQPNFTKWQFAESKEIEDGVNNLIIKINYREPVVWQFDEENENYLRFQNGDQFLDDKGEQIKARNIVIQKTEIKIIDEIGHRSVNLNGTGEALIFRDGKMITGKWQYSDFDFRTKFYNTTGEEIKFLPGLTWIEVISNQHQIIY